MKKLKAMKTANLIRSAILGITLTISMFVFFQGFQDIWQNNDHFMMGIFGIISFINMGIAHSIEMTEKDIEHAEERIYAARAAKNNAIKKEKEFEMHKNISDYNITL